MVSSRSGDRRIYQLHVIRRRRARVKRICAEGRARREARPGRCKERVAEQGRQHRHDSPQNGPATSWPSRLDDRPDQHGHRARSPGARWRRAPSRQAGSGAAAGAKGWQPATGVIPPRAQPATAGCRGDRKPPPPRREAAEVRRPGHGREDPQTRGATTGGKPTARRSPIVPGGRQPGRGRMAAESRGLGFSRESLKLSAGRRRPRRNRPADTDRPPSAATEPPPDVRSRCVQARPSARK